MIFLIFGPDSFRAKQKINQVKAKFLKEVDASGLSVSEVDGQTLNLVEFHNLFAATSLFSRRRLVILENTILNKDKEVLASLAEYLKNNKNQENILIFYEPAITLDKKNAPAIAQADYGDKPLTKNQQLLFSQLQAGDFNQFFGLLDNIGLAAWIKTKLAAQNFDIDYKAQQLLTAIYGTDLWALNSELDKLIAYQSAQNNNLIDLPAVMLMVDGKAETKIFDLTDALSNKQKAVAVKLLEEQLDEGANPVYLTTMIMRQIKILLTIRACLDNGMDSRAIGSLTKLHPYVLQKGINQARNFNLDNLKGLFSALVRLDYNHKSGKLNPELMLSLLLARI